MPPPMALDAPPMQPPQVQAGGPTPPPMAGVGGMLANKPPGGGANGALIAKFDAVKKVLESMGTDSSVMQPYVARAIAVLTSGIEEVVKTPGIGGASPPPSPGSARPTGTEVGQGFPG